ncbi:MAG: hypothetical protein E7565_08645 [Ruminococcaceae bacterium]|nr:hypothetical protein [Oscillospiraceae bacterium]
MLYILADPIYKKSIWCNEILDGILSAAKEKRTDCTVVESADEVKSGQVIIVATNPEFIKENCRILENYPVKIVVSSPKISAIGSPNCSFVGFDSENSIFEISKFLTDCGKENIALFGVNDHSVNDLLKKQNFLAANGNAENVFLNNGNIKECFDSFYERLNTFNAVLCTNSYVAFYLVKKLKEAKYPTDKIDVISLCDSVILELSKPQISAIRVDYFSLGKAAFDTARILKKNDTIKSLNVSVEWKLIGRQTANIPDTLLNSFDENEENPTDVFYEDDELELFMIAERLFDGCDQNDLKLLKMLKNGYKLDQICEELFMSESGVKYRLKKLLNISKTNSKSQLTDFISKLDIDL